MTRIEKSDLNSFILEVRSGAQGEKNFAPRSHFLPLNVMKSSLYNCNFIIHKAKRGFRLSKNARYSNVLLQRDDFFFLDDNSQSLRQDVKRIKK